MAVKHFPVNDTGMQIVSVSPLPSATGGQFGSVVSTTPSTLATQFMLISGAWTPGGVSGENITIDFQVTFSDTTTSSFVTSQTIVGNLGGQNITSSNVASLCKAGVWIVSVSAKAMSSISSSTATPQVNYVLVPVS